MVSNQAKAYDRVFVAGPAAKDRYLKAVAWIDQNKLITVGRPQLDLGQTPFAAEPKLKTITYAPTWEGEDEANNYTSMDLYGKKIIDAALSQSDCRTIYKPHPRILTSKDPEVVAAHKYIVSRLNKAPHQVLLEGDVIEEGRWGNSIRIGSTVKNTPNNWSISGSNGDPILIIRNGQGIQTEEGWVPTIEDINNDDSSIYVTSTQNVPLIASSVSYISYKNK
jgi:hypothetical protein